MSQTTAQPLSESQRHEVSEWISTHAESFPESVRDFFAAHQKYLSADQDLRRRFEETVRELRRALGITPSSERRRSGDPLSQVPRSGAETSGKAKEGMETKRERSMRLGQWHAELSARHKKRIQRIEERLEQQGKAHKNDGSRAEEPGVIEEMALEEEELPPEEEAAASELGKEFAEHLEAGEGSEPEFQSVNEALMPENTMLNAEQVASLPVKASESLPNAKVVKILDDNRVRYDITISVSRLELDVKKQVVKTANGERTVIAAKTDEYGPARYQVTWSTLATLAILVGQFAMPLNRLGKLFSCVGKRFTASSLSRLLHYVAERFVAIYITLGEQLADSEIIGGDDTSSRVLEVNKYFEQQKRSQVESENRAPPPWSDYRTSGIAEESIERCETQKRQRLERREAGDREAKRTPEEDPSLGMLIGRHYDFESQRQDGKGGKKSLNTTVVSGRSIANDPRSLTVFYRSHLGSCGDLLESILKSRRPSSGDLMLQADLSTTNLIRDPKLLERFNFELVGCSAHARRPFALYEKDDSVYCPLMLHLFTGLALHEKRLDVHGRNRQNILAVRQTDSRRLWENIKELAKKMKKRWSRASKLGTGARYILKHYDKLTKYLDDPRLEPTNNLRERMLRTENLIEKSSMFRKTLEGRFVLDIIRTVLQTAVASGVPIRDYLISVLRADPKEVNDHPERFTPLAYA